MSCVILEHISVSCVTLEPISIQTWLVVT